MLLFQLLLGIVLLVQGRKLFWLFVGAVGFVVGLSLATQNIGGMNVGLAVVIAVIAGILGAILGVVLQRVAVGMAGFLAGGYVISQLPGVFSLQVGAFFWLVYLIGGGIGAILMAFFFDWALIVLSSLTGTTLITQAIHLRPPIILLLFIVLVAVGITFQASLLQREEPN